MEKDLIKFNNNIEFIGSKDIVKYIDDKGNCVLLPISQLLCNCEYVELDDAQLKIAIYNGEVEKDLKLETAEVVRKIDKFYKTKKESDKGTIIETKVKISKVWLVRNGVRLTKSYNNKNDALKYVEETNNKLLKEAKLID